MTFKHVKFEDSPTMRALEKVAREKGLVKPESLQKKADVTKKADYTPSSDFMENIFKLCSGLRAQGLVKEASEIETNYLNYKQAQTLYETSKETGEDLVQSAHPKGSHKLEGVEGEEATVEDILDQHKKIVDVVDKKPHGKLASNTDVLKAVRVALGGVAEFTAADLGGSAWTRLLSFLGRAAPSGIELATPGAVAAGGGEAAAGGILATTIPTAGAAGALAIGASVAAIVASAVAGGYIGSALFDHYYSVTDLKEAGDRVVSEAKDVESDFLPNEYTHVVGFQRLLDRIASQYKVVEKLKSGTNVTPNDLKMMANLSSIIQQSNKEAQSIWSYAMGHKDDQFLGFIRGFGDVVAAAKNYMEVSQKTIAAFDSFAAEAAQVVSQQVKEQVASKGGDVANTLSNKYATTLKTIKNYMDRIKAARPNDQNAQLTWLQGVASYVDKEQKEFSAVDPENKSSVVKSYSDRLDNAISKLDAFKAAKLS